MGSKSGGFGSLTRRHGFKCIPDSSVTVEECLLAVGEKIGYGNINSAARMNKAIVVFLSSELLVNRIVEEGLNIKESFVSVLPLASPVTKVILSNVPPFIKDKLIINELLRYGKIMSPIKPILLGCKNPDVKHVMSFRRQVFVLLNDPNSPIEVAWTFNIDGSNYVIFASTESMKCFHCGGQGHLRRACPQKNNDSENNKAREPASGEDGVSETAPGAEQQTQPPAQTVRPEPAPRLKRGIGAEDKENNKETGAETLNTPEDADFQLVEKKRKRCVATPGKVAEEGQSVWDSETLSQGSGAAAAQSSGTGDQGKAGSQCKPAITPRSGKRGNSGAAVQSSAETASRSEDLLPDTVAVDDAEESEEESVISEMDDGGELSDSSVLLDEALPNPSGVTLWDSKALENDLNVHQKPNSDFTLSTSDSFKEKSNLLDVSASLMASFMGGLIVVGGSAKYLKNDVSSTRQCRVTMKYSKTVRYEQLTMSQLGNITYPQVFEQQTATHVVTAVLYGAQAFMVFDQMASADENKQEIEGKLHVMVKKIPELSFEGEGAVKLTEDEKKTAHQFSCTFHGDFDLKHSPTTYQEAIEVYKTLPGLLGEKGEKAVPLRVWLYPLRNLDPKAARLVREIRVDLVSQVEEVLDLLREVNMRARDMTGNSLLNGFPDLKDRLSEFQHKTLQYKIGVFEKAVSRVLPAIRGGREEEEEEGEAALAVILKIHNASPFSGREMHRWLDEKECEMKVLKLYTAALKDVPLMKSTVELDGVLFDPEIETVVCFAFTKLQDNEEYLLTLTQCLESKEFRKLEKNVHSDLRVYTVEPQPWFTSPKHSDTMRRNLELFRGLSEINKHQKKTRFIVASISDYSRPGASICLYSRGAIADSQFKCLSKPQPPVPTDIQPDSVTLKLLPPEVGECERYRVEHRAVQRAAETGTEPGQEEWTATDTPDTQESWTLSGLQPGMLYQVRYRGVRALLASEASEAVEVHTKLGSGSAPGQPSVHRAGAYGAWVSWKKPAGAVEGGLSVAQYRVEYKDATHALWSSQLTDGDVTTCTVEGLKLARSYTFRVYSVFAEGALSAASPETKLLSEAEYVPDLNQRPYQTTLMCVGGPGGDPFSFYGLNNGVTLKTIRVHFSVYWIRCIQVELSSGLKATFGGSTMPFKKVFEFHFDFCPGERFSALAIYDTWAPPYGTMLGGIRFTTTQGRHFHAKSNNMASCEEYSVDVGSGVCLGVEGRHGWEVDCLGFVFIK